MKAFSKMVREQRADTEGVINYVADQISSSAPGGGRTRKLGTEGCWGFAGEPAGAQREVRGEGRHRPCRRGHEVAVASQIMFPRGTGLSKSVLR